MSQKSNLVLSFRLHLLVGDSNMRSVEINRIRNDDCSDLVPIIRHDEIRNEIHVFSIWGEVRSLILIMNNLIPLMDIRTTVQ